MTAGPAPGRAANPARTVFLGSGSFAVPILDTLAADPRVRLVGVVTAPDRPAGRGNALRPTPIALRARAMWVPLLQPARVREPEALAAIAALEPDLGVLADYGQIVPRALLDLPRLGILNVHPSLLPRHRGATPIQATITEGDERTGVSVIRMDEGVDTGPIVGVSEWPLSGTETTPELEAAAAREGAALLTRVLGGWLDGSAEARPQDDASATVTRTLRRADGRLDPAFPATALERRVRAHVPWPGSFLESPAGRLAVHRASVAASQDGDEPGRLVTHGDGLALTTADGRLVLKVVQLAGRKAMTGEDLLRGQPALVAQPVATEARA
jgi:methionyl-tRNA formyltransferase